jgi:protein-disulfide isomerase
MVILYSLTILISLAPLWSQTPAKSDVLAEIDGAAIKADEVDRAIGMQISKLEEQIYQLRQRKLEALIGEKLLAAEALKRGIETKALLDAEVTSKVGLVTEQEIDSFYQANKAQLKGEEATLREQIRPYLQNQKLTAQREAFLKSLRSQAKVTVYLKSPPVYRAEVPVEGAPFKGPEKAPITIVEVSDFHCPYCKRVQPTLSQILSKYGDRVKLVFRDLPLDQLHPDARKAAEAARCANDQGKFWPYHDKLMAAGNDASPEKLKAYAQELELDAAAFEQCLSSRKHQAAVQKDIEEGARLGVTGTPAFFINGRLLSGAQPLDAFVKVIEEELSRVP